MYSWVEFLFGALLSSRGADDLRRLNPYLSESRLDLILQLVITVVLRANRVGHANRCIGAAIKLQQQLKKVVALSAAERSAIRSSTLPNILQASESLAKQLLTKRVFVEKSVESKPLLLFDPRYLIFE